MRMSWARCTAQQVIQGRTKLFHESVPMEGNHLSFSENSSIRHSPMKKEGMAQMSMEAKSVTLSTMLYCLTADNMPIGMPRITISATEPSASLMVLGSRAASSSITGIFEI